MAAAEAEAAACEKALLAALAASPDGRIADSGVYASSCQPPVDTKLLAGTIRSLASSEFIVAEEVAHSRWVLTPEGQRYFDAGATPEAALFAAVPQDGVPLKTLQASLGAEAADIGLKQAMAAKWVGLEKAADGSQLVRRKTASAADGALALLRSAAAGGDLTKPESDGLKKRKLVVAETWQTYVLARGPRFALTRTKPATELTREMIADGSYATQEFKPYNYAAKGLPPAGGALHPVMKVRSAFRQIFMQMGFTEMPTNNFVESSFWNFDALFQPQQHPARDAHDTFFMRSPDSADMDSLPQDYIARVKEMHEHGGHGSAGYGYAWSRAESAKLLLRTHTTAVSSKMLHRLASDGFKPAKYFSVDRVFRNESVDKTHLAEFHQVEGLICDKGLTLGDLIGTLAQFFERMGLTGLKVKPAYNPYTEPSMEIFCWHPKLGKEIEVGNSGMFRPEMLLPMGMPPDVRVIAWGIGLERPSMILYGIDNIRDLFGHKASLGVIRSTPICRMGIDTGADLAAAARVRDEATRAAGR